MPKRAKGITAAGVKSLPPGSYTDGGGLILLVRGPAARFWLYRYQVAGRRREMGLGAAVGRDAVSLAAARRRADDLRRSVRAGIDPLAQRDAEAAAASASAAAKAARLTFRQVAGMCIASREAGWRNDKHRHQWQQTLTDFAYGHFGDLPVADVDTAHVMLALDPIWRVKPETASRVRGRIEAVLDYASAREWRRGENPARWRGHLESLLPARSKLATVEHHAALPWREIGSFMAALRAQEGNAAKALELIILTAARTKEAIGARWDEIDLKAKVWTIPAERMKAGKEHRVPLSEPALAVLLGMLPLRNPEAGDWVFPGQKEGRPLSNMACLMALRRMGRGDLTAHGFRSTFRDWAGESTSYPRELAEAALAHAIESKVEAAYRRGDALERRRPLMDDWASFCGRAPAAEEDNVVRLRAVAGDE
jgi:integrase